ncbi:MAG: hypothetical protein RR561_01840 [Peptostreptococcus sp.]|uniref:hypothetical protein n=1 Tax=Peptostreptococcus sp. TaxID=1262 RepID=UPI002FC59D87
MKIKKKQFLDKVRTRLISFRLPRDMVDQIISEIEIKYDFELERGRSDDDIIKGYSSAEELANKYASIFGYNKKHVDKFADNRELTFLDRFQDWKKDSEQELDYTREKKESKNRENTKSKNTKSTKNKKNTKEIANNLEKAFNVYNDFSDIFK